MRKFANNARDEVKSVSRDDTVIREGIWNDQVGDVIEFYAAWTPHTDANKYPQDRALVMRLLAGRKNCRDFKQSDAKDAGLPKSSLDGQRPTVLKGDKSSRENWPSEVRRLLRLSTGEQLDVIGVTKRLGKMEQGEPRYPSVARVAAETWLRGIEGRQKQEFNNLHELCRAVPNLHKVKEPNYSYFRYEGTVIYKDRHADLVAELGEEARQPLERVAQALSKFNDEPMPYLAALVADGDGMGRKLSELKSADEHREFSKKLAAFADEARATVADPKHSGVLIYAGGDDVLAFLPLHTCLACARALRERFHKDTDMTLSVGIGIGHFMENMEDLLEYARAAEKSAKGVEGKDALAVHLHKRGGSPIRICGRWERQPDERIEKFATLMNKGIIPTKLPYELRSMAKLYEKGWNDEQAKAAIELDLVRLIAKKQSKGQETVRQALKDIQVKNAKELLVLAEELLVARQIARAFEQRGEVH